jgi:hypothetical protein
MREVFLKPNIEFTFDNKYIFWNYFPRSILSFYKKLNNRYNSIEYGGIWLTSRWIVKYSEWDFDDESGTEKSL